MKNKIFSVYDSKAKAYNTPFFMQTAGMAIRGFTDLANDVQTMINKHPEDYILYEIGTFDDADANLSMLIPPANLGIATDYIKEQKVIKPEVV